MLNGDKYLAQFHFRGGIDYRPNPCGYFAIHIASLTVTDWLKKLAEENDGEIVQIKSLGNFATYDLDDPHCVRS